MIRLSLASVRHRRGGVAASMLSIFLGAAVLMAFASMLDTAGGSGVSPADQSTLTVIASVVGGWGTLVVASAVVTAQAVAAAQRASELALLRSAGATPAQVSRLITAEVAVLGALAVLLALPVGLAGGYVLLHILRQTHQVGAGVGFRFGGAAIGMGGYGTLVVAMLATWLTARRAGKRQVQDAVLAAKVGSRQMPRWRVVSGLLLLAAGISCAALTAAVLDGTDIQTQGVAAEAAILSSLGLALLSPALLRWATAVVGPVLRRLGNAPAELAVLDLRRRGTRAAAPAMPILVCTAIAYGTLAMQAMWDSTHHLLSVDDKSTKTLNYVVVGMIVVFAAVMLVNLVVTDTSHRQREFAQLRLAGATPGQILRMVGCQDVLLLVVGLAFGTLAGLLTVIPYSVCVSHRALPPSSSWALYLGVLGGVSVLTVGASLVTTRRTQRGADVAAIRMAER